MKKINIDEYKLLIYILKQVDAGMSYDKEGKDYRDHCDITMCWDKGTHKIFKSLRQKMSDKE